jgi:hypothetical protein
LAAYLAYHFAGELKRYATYKNTMVDQTMNIDPAVLQFFEINEENKKQIEKHKEMRESEEYKNLLKYLKQTVLDFIKTLQLCNFAASRWDFYTDNYLFPRHFDDIIESAVTAQLAIENGALNPARRELRHILEVAVNMAFVDEEVSRYELEERINFFKSKKVTKRNVDHIKDLPLRMLGDNRSDFKNETINCWVTASNYVHFTKRTMDEKIKIRSEGIKLGFESLEMLEQLVKEIHHVLSIIVILAFETIGPTFTGDILSDGLDGDDNWHFHKNKHIAAIDAHFDYKAERKDRLKEHIERRNKRISEK